MVYYSRGQCNIVPNCMMRCEIEPWSLHRGTIPCTMVPYMLDLENLDGQGVRLLMPAPMLRGGEGTVDWDTVGSNCSIEKCLSNLNKRISSKSSNWQISARWGFPTVSSPLPKYTSDSPPKSGRASCDPVPCAPAWVVTCVHQYISLSLSLSIYLSIYIYIYICIERERDVYKW